MYLRLISYDVVTPGKFSDTFQPTMDEPQFVSTSEKLKSSSINSNIIYWVGFMEIAS